MRVLILSAITLLGAGLIVGRANAARFGSLTLSAGETRNAYTGMSGYNMRVCNDFYSSGSVIATISGNAPHDLSPGQCAEDIGDRLVVQNHSSGPARVYFRSINDNQDHKQRDN
jgi:hypothetical protein